MMATLVFASMAADVNMKQVTYLCTIVYCIY